MPGDILGMATTSEDMLTSNGVKRSNVESGVFSGQESNVSDHDQDIYGLLEQKERDLLLAAELGKALLEKNEELSTTNEKMAEEFSSKLEVGTIFEGFFLLVYKVWFYAT